LRSDWKTSGLRLVVRLRERSDQRRTTACAVHHDKSRLPETTGPSLYPPDQDARVPCGYCTTRLKKIHSTAILLPPCHRFATDFNPRNEKGLTAICRKPLSRNQCGKQDLNLHDLAATRPSSSFETRPKHRRFPGICTYFSRKSPYVKTCTTTRVFVGFVGNTPAQNGSLLFCAKAVPLGEIKMPFFGVITTYQATQVSIVIFTSRYLRGTGARKATPNLITLLEGNARSGLLDHRSHHNRAPPDI
jgi:hypothetical protein